MLTLQTQLHVDDLAARDVFDFLIHPTDERYQHWWPGTHVHFHTVHGRPGTIGNVVSMDEYVGGRRIRMQGIVVEAVGAARIVWQLRRGIRLPVWLALDPVFRLYFSRRFAQALDEHVREEFPRLRNVLPVGSPSPADQTAVTACFLPVGPSVLFAPRHGSLRSS